MSHDGHSFHLQYPRGGGGVYLDGDLTEGFMRYEFGGLIFGGAYFRNFTVNSKNILNSTAT